jgi:mediator of RNA polymerase II transcription subunit 12, fungi type
MTAFVEHADFFPWTGNHPEDVLSEQTTKSGFYDKTQVTQNEMQTARPSLWPACKARSGLVALSSLFVAVLEKRQEHGRISAPSTFKPPPRVTLTDSRREAWLRDLANQTVPLRRLSRTIPHGIAGKRILDQCLSKNIPTERAVWLARCIGANEMRAVKRKGAGGAFALGGEAKWIKDWTVFVHQFLESVISSCGQAEWKTKMSYAYVISIRRKFGSILTGHSVRLSTHLYSEHLLDRDQYLDLYMSSLEGSNLEKLPAWLLMLDIYSTELLQSRRTAKRLVEALLGILKKVRITVLPVMSLALLTYVIEHSIPGY